MNYKTSKKGQRGQALILIAFAAVGLFAFSALAIDGSRSFSNKRQAQNAADTAALTAALKYIRTTGTDAVKYAAAQDAALLRAESNGFEDDPDGIPLTQPNVQVYVQRCDELIDEQTGGALTCQGLPAGITTAQKAEFIRVRIVSTIPTTFGRVIGRQTLTSAAEAIARVQGSSTSSTGGFSSGAAMVAINDQKSGVCFRMNGGAYVYTHNSGIFINCDSTDAIFMNTNMELRMDANGQVVGCYNTSSGNKNDPAYDHDPIDCDANGGESVSYSAADFADVPTMPSPVPTCSGTARKSGNKYIEGGTMPTSIIDTSTEFSAGVYCFDGDLNVQGHSNVTGTGLVVFVMRNGKSVNLQSGETFNFENLEVWSNGNGVFRIGGNLIAQRLRYYSSGTGNFSVLSGASVTANNAYIYLKEGNIEWNSDSNLNMHAPPQDDPFGVGGLLVHKPYKELKPNGEPNDTRITFNGGSNCDLYGTFLTPTSPITLNGGTGFELHSQIIGWDYIINGGAKADIWYNASENYNPPVIADPTIELTK